MITVEVQVKEDANLAYLEQLMGELPLYLEKWLWHKLLLVAHSVVVTAKTYAPVRTGKLRDSIVAVLTVDGIAVRATIDYAKFVELGTKYQLPQMFLYNAMTDHYEEIRQTVVDCIQDYFRGVVA